MQKANILFGLIGLVLGVTIGYFATQQLNKNVAPPKSAMSDAAGGQAAGSGPPAQVLELLNKARSEPENFELQKQAAALYQQIGRPEKAVEFLKQAAKLKPNDAEVLQDLTQVLINTGNKAEAQETLKQLEKASPKNPAIAEFKKQLGS